VAGKYAAGAGGRQRSALDLLLLHQAYRTGRAALTHYADDPPSVLTFQTALVCSSAELHAWHSSPRAFAQLLPPWPPIEMILAPQGLEPGTRVELVICLGPLRISLLNEITSHSADGFVDEQVHGPWGYWRHEHYFHSVADQHSFIEDRVYYRLPFGILGRLMGDWLAQWELQRLFRYRHARLKEAFAVKACKADQEEV
jgi:ligand-binding SRPBCC domain-containing protein